MNEMARTAPALTTSPVQSRSLIGASAMLAFATAVVVATEFIVVGLLPEMARDLNISVAEAGWFVTWFAVSSAILGPPLTIAASKTEPRRVFAAVLLAFALGNFVATLVPNYPVIVAVAGLAGAGREGQAVALVYIGVVVAIVVAVPAGVILADYSGWPTSFVSLAVLAFIGALILGTAFPRRESPGLASMKAQTMILRRPMVQAHLLLSAMLFAAMFTGYSYLAALLEEAAGFDSRQIAAALMGLALQGSWATGSPAAWSIGGRRQPPPVSQSS